MDQKQEKQKESKKKHPITDNKKREKNYEFATKKMHKKEERHPSLLI